MPYAPLHPCPVPGCPALVAHGRCPAHTAPAAAQGWNPHAPRVRGRQLQRLRTQLFDAEPLCRQCAQEGRVAIATIRDHIVPIAEGGTDEASNIQPLCRSCSDRKTHRESQRGKTRRRW